MKLKFSVAALFGIILSLFSYPMLAQQADGCGTEMPDHYIDYVQQVKRSALYQHYMNSGVRGKKAELTYVPVQIHIVRESDGTGRTTTEDALNSLCEANEDFDTVGFFFFMKNPIKYINSSTYYEHNFFQGFQMMNANNVDNAVNIYFVEDAAGACGYFSPSGDAVAITRSCSGSNTTTLTHELGHFFGLPHTFNGWENGSVPPASFQENVNGSNCTIAGDGFCDTPPDYVSDRWSCPYSGPQLFDANNQQVIPDHRFFMSYSSDACQDRFSAEQIAFMQSELNNDRKNLLVPSNPIATEPGKVVLTSPANSSVNIPSSGTEFTWDAQPGATHYHIIVGRFASFLNYEFEATVTGTSYTAPQALTPNTFHYFKVKAMHPFDVCAEYSSIFAFQTGSATGIGETVNNLPLRLYPNPARVGESITLDLPEDRAGTLYVYDLLGRERMVQNFATGTAVTADLPVDLTDGVYSLRWVSEDGTSFTGSLLVRP